MFARRDVGQQTCHSRITVECAKDQRLKRNSNPKDANEISGFVRFRETEVWKAGGASNPTNFIDPIANQSALSF